MSWRGQSSLVFEPVCGTSLEQMCVGHCENSTCVCPHGMENDRIFFRYQTCSAPIAWFEALHAVSIIVGLVAIWVGYRRLRYHDLRGGQGVRWLIYLFIASSVTLTAGDVVCLVDGYASRAYWICLATFFIVQPISFARTMWLFFRMSYSLLGAQMVHKTTVIRLLLLFYVVTITPIGVILPIWILTLGDGVAPGYDVAQYNAVLAWCFMIFPIHLIISLPLNVYVTHDLIVKVEEALAAKNVASANVESMRDAHRRLRMFRIVNSIVLPIVEVVFITFLVGVAGLYRLPLLPYSTGGLSIQANATMVQHIQIVSSDPSKKSSTVVVHDGTRTMDSNVNNNQGLSKDGRIVSSHASSSAPYSSPSPTARKVASSTSKG